MVRIDGKLVETDWSTALEKAGGILKDAGNQLAVLASASLPVEELYATQKLARALGSNNVDHRLGQTDFSAQENSPVMPWLGMELADLETLDAALLVGSNIRKDQPIAALRLRKSALKGGQISFINPKQFPLHFDAMELITARYDHLVTELGCVAKAAGADLSGLDKAPNFDASDAHKRIADSLKDGERAAVVLGNIAVQHPAYAQLQFLAIALSKATGATLSMLPERGNTAGAWLTGCVPHRLAGGDAASKPGLHAREMLETPQSHYLLVGVEVEFDAANPAQAVNALAKSSGVVSLSAFLSDSLRDHADVVLPIATFPESFGTFVNATGNWQSAKGVSAPPGDARPVWKIIRVLAEGQELSGFAYESPETLTKEAQQKCSSVSLNNLTDLKGVGFEGASKDTMVRVGETPIYATDPLVRRSQPLQKSTDGKQAFASMAQAEFDKLGLSDGDSVKVKQGSGQATLPAKADNTLPEGCVWVPAGLVETQMLGDLFAAIEVQKA